MEQLLRQSLAILKETIQVDFIDQCVYRAREYWRSHLLQSIVCNPKLLRWQLYELFNLHVKVVFIRVDNFLREKYGPLGLLFFAITYCTLATTIREHVLLCSANLHHELLVFRNPLGFHMRRVLDKVIREVILYCEVVWLIRSGCQVNLNILEVDAIIQSMVKHEGLALVRIFSQVSRTSLRANALESGKLLCETVTLEVIRLLIDMPFIGGRSHEGSGGFKLVKLNVVGIRLYVEVVETEVTLLEY